MNEQRTSQLPYDRALAELKAIYAREGLRAAVIFLNRLAGHRFSALFRFDDETLRSFCFYDRDNPPMESSDEIPVTASYCIFVRRSSAKFSVVDSFNDERVEGHPKQPEVRAYCGVPLRDRNGRLFGTICHFDLNPMPISDLDVELMEAMADLLKDGEAGLRPL